MRKYLFLFSLLVCSFFFFLFCGTWIYRLNLPYDENGIYLDRENGKLIFESTTKDLMIISSILFVLGLVLLFFYLKSKKEIR